MQLTLDNKRQPFPWGCQYYALYSLVGDERILADTSECSDGRFRLQMAQLGYHLHPAWVDQTDTYTTTPEWWRKVVTTEDVERYADAPSLTAIPMLVDVRSTGFAGVAHRVGIAVLAKPGLPVLVFDPAQDEKQEFETLEDFIASPYSQCFHVYLLFDGSPTFFTGCYGPDAPHVTPAVRGRWQQLQETA